MRTPEVGEPTRRNDTDHMGMDPTRPHQRRPADYLFVGATVVAGILLLLWVFFGSA